MKTYLCLIKHHPLKTYGGVEVRFHAFLTLALDGGEQSASCPPPLYSEEGAFSAQWTGGWVDHRASMDVVAKEKKKKPCFC